MISQDKPLIVPEDEIMEVYIDELRKSFFDKREIYAAGTTILRMLDLCEMIVERDGGKMTIREAVAKYDKSG